MKNEIWKPVAGYEDFYLVSDMGNIRSVDRKVEGIRYGKPYEFILKGRMMSFCVDNKGYYRVGLSKNCETKTHKVHRLVAEAFIGDVEGLQVDHINTVRTDNRVENLRIVTNKENANNPLSKQHYSKASYGKVAKKVKCICEDGKEIIFRSITDAVEQGYGTCISCISTCCHGRKKTHNNKKWEFI